MGHEINLVAHQTGFCWSGMRCYRTEWNRLHLTLGRESTVLYNSVSLDTWEPACVVTVFLLVVQNKFEGIFSNQRSNLCPLHWQEDSYPLPHQGSPKTMAFKGNIKIQGPTNRHSPRMGKRTVYQLQSPKPNKDNPQSVPFR